MTNRVELVGLWAPRETLRFTPAGIPVIDGLLQYSGEVVEGGKKRQVQLQIRVKVVGPLANTAAQITAQAMIRVEGFLAPQRSGSSSLVLHAQNFQPVAVNRSGSIE